MRRVLIVLVVVFLALTLALAVSADCGGKCEVRRMDVTPVLGQRGNACSTYANGTRTILPCPTPGP